MPLEVREIGIKLSVGDEAGADRTGPDPRGCGTRLSAGQRREIVEECVAAVLAALKEAEER